jgi:hypothetical protein
MGQLVRILKYVELGRIDRIYGLTRLHFDTAKQVQL